QTSRDHKGSLFRASHNSTVIHPEPQLIRKQLNTCRAKGIKPTRSRASIPRVVLSSPRTAHIHNLPTIVSISHNLQVCPPTSPAAAPAPPLPALALGTVQFPIPARAPARARALEPVATLATQPVLPAVVTAPVARQPRVLVVRGPLVGVR
ncbi:hypothetical protein B0T13DRAFT_535406, partial [Neurospora crassa]